MRILAILFGVVAAKPKWMNIDFLTSFADYMLNDQQDLQMCILGTLGPVADVMQAKEDFNKSFVDHNFTEFAEGVNDLATLFKDIPPALKTCAPVEGEAKFDLDAFKNITGFKSLIHHVEQNIAGDTKELVLPSLKKAKVSCKAQDWTECGKALGEAYHVMLIAPYPDEIKLQGHKSFLSIDFTVSFLDYLLDDDGDLMACIFGALAPVADAEEGLADIKAALHSHNITRARKFLGDMHSLFETDLPAAMKKCDVPSADAKAVLGMLSGIKSLKDLIKQMHKNWKNDPDGLILAEFEGAFQAAAKKDQAGMGQHLGALVHRLIVNTTYPDEKAVIV